MTLLIYDTFFYWVPKFLVIFSLFVVGRKLGHKIGDITKKWKIMKRYKSTHVLKENVGHKNMRNNTTVKTVGFWVIGIGGVYGAYFQDFKTGGAIIGIGAIIIALGDTL